MTADKEYTTPFLLEPTKLQRILEKAVERLGDHGCAVTRTHFEISFSGNRHDVYDDLNTVLALENLRKQKIQRLIINCASGRKNTTKFDHEIQIDFNGPSKRTPIPANSEKRVVSISVKSDSPGWPNRTLSELEEQVERTWMPHFQPLLILWGVLVAALVVIFLQLPLKDIYYDGPSSMWLREKDLEYFNSLTKDGRTLTDEEVRELNTRQLRNLLETQKPKQHSQAGRARQVICVVIPLIAVIICGVVLLATGYPRAVFLWGDEVERYNRLVQRRKLLWSVIIGVPVVGLLANIFIIGVATYLPGG